MKRRFLRYCFRIFTGGLALPAAGCGLFLGLDEFEDTPPSASTGTGGTSGSTTCTPASVESCYSGPSETLGVGACKDGKHTCNDEGTAYSECLGQVTPTAETCANPLDEDCNGTDCLLWASIFGDVSNQTATAIALDQDTNLIIAGRFQGTITLDPATPISANGTDIYVAKFDPSAKLLWAKSFDSSGNPSIEGIATDDSGNIIITGTNDGAINFGGPPVQSFGYGSIFIAKLDPNGNHQWSKEIHRSDLTTTPRIAVDKTGDIAALSKSSCTECEFGFTVTTWLDKLHPDGSQQWSKPFLTTEAGGSETIDKRTISGVAIDPFGNTIITGGFSGQERFSTVTFTSAGGNDIFLAKFDSNGNHVWSKHFGDTGHQTATGITSDRLGSVIITGTFENKVDLTDIGNPLQSVGDTDIFIAKFNSAGNHLWSKSFGAPGTQEATAVATDTINNILLTGSTTGSIDYGGGTLAPGGGLDIPLIKLDANGEHLWSKAFGDAEDQSGRAVAASLVGEVFLVGDVEGTIEITQGGGELSSAGGTDIFVGKFAP